ncbi:MAG: tRNA 4-thiouridine(8) synthase ThiI [Syntrophobacter sp.]
MNPRIQGIGLLSGGLDSTLAVKVLQEQGLELLAITFVTPFFGPEAGLEAGAKAGVPTISVDISQRHLDMLKHPRYGYGSQMNPCIDCHALMLNEAGRLMEKEGAGFLFTGEVLGQRPMSQRRDSLRSVEKLSGYPGYILRPLCAKLLPPTRAEETGLVNREKLLDIQGRSRKRQAELARRFGITDYPQPGGGCMLTKEGFSSRLRSLLSANADATAGDVEIIKWGRAFRLPARNICMVGRNLADNTKLDQLAREDDIHLRSYDYPGPTGLIVASPSPMEDIDTAAGLVASYGDGPRNTPIRVHWRHKGNTGYITVEVKARDSYKEMLL